VPDRSETFIARMGAMKVFFYAVRDFYPICGLSAVF